MLTLGVFVTGFIKRHRLDSHAVPTDHGDAPKRTGENGISFGSHAGCVTIFLVVYSITLDHAFLSKTKSEDGRWYSNPNVVVVVPDSQQHLSLGVWSNCNQRHVVLSHGQYQWRTEMQRHMSITQCILLCHCMSGYCGHSSVFTTHLCNLNMTALDHRIGTGTEDQLGFTLHCSASRPEISSAVLPASLQASTMCLRSTTMEVKRVS